MTTTITQKFESALAASVALAILLDEIKDHPNFSLCEEMSEDFETRFKAVYRAAATLHVDLKTLRYDAGQTEELYTGLSSDEEDEETDYEDTEGVALQAHENLSFNLSLIAQMKGQQRADATQIISSLAMTTGEVISGYVEEAREILMLRLRHLRVLAQLLLSVLCRLDDTISSFRAAVLRGEMSLAWQLHSKATAELAELRDIAA